MMTPVPPSITASDTSARADAQEDETFLDHLLGASGDAWGSRASLATPGDGGSIVVSPIGSFDAPAESTEDIERIMQLLVQTGPSDS